MHFPKIKVTVVKVNARKASASPMVEPQLRSGHEFVDADDAFYRAVVAEIKLRRPRTTVVEFSDDWKLEGLREVLLMPDTGGDWQLATGNWQLATGNWRLTTDSKIFAIVHDTRIRRKKGAGVKKS
ncbi:hypothetical protein JOM56_006792 [Amanita muscaria]